MRTVVNWIRNKLRTFLGVADPVEEIPAAAERKGISIHEELLRRAGEKAIVRRPVAPPKLMPGVVPTTLPTDDPGNLGPYLAADSNLLASTYNFATVNYCGLGFPGYAYLAELSQRSEYRAASETIAQEMTREFIKLVVKGDGGKKDGDDKQADGEAVTGANDEAAKEKEDKLEKLTEAIEKFKVCEHFYKVAELDGLYGRAQLFIDIDYGGRDQKEMRQLPLVVDKATIPKGSLKGFKVIEPLWTTPYSYDANDPTSPDFYKPRAWFVMGQRIHASRLLTFISREVPDMLKPAYNFGGLSMSQLLEPYVFQWLRTRNSVSDLIHNFSIIYLATNMGDVLSGEPDKPGGLIDRAQLFVDTRDNKGLFLVDKEKEEIGAVNVPLSGLDKLQAQAQEHMAAPSHIPLVKLLGVTPTGLNASSEGEIKVFYDYVRAMQKKLFADHLNTVLQVLQLHLFGEIDDSIGFEFIPLSAPTVKELAEIRKANAETDATYIDKGVLDPREVREKIANDPESGYNNISGPAPTPPDMGTLERQHELGEESAEAAHERNLEAQEREQKAAA